MFCLAYRVIKVSRKFILFLRKYCLLAPVPSFACSFLSFSYFLLSFARIYVYQRRVCDKICIEI